MIYWLLLLLGWGNAPASHTVEIRGMAFHPAVLTVAVGDRVVWVNRDIVPHTATAKVRTTWDTGQLVQGQTGSYITSRPGTFRYVCTFHPTMVGKLIVR